MMISKNKWVPYLFILPALAGLIIFKLYPIISALIESLYSKNFLSSGSSFVGFGNYAKLFSDPTFWNSLKVTGLFNIIINPLQIILAIGLGLLLNKPIKHIALFRGINFIPVAVSVPTAAILWRIMLSPEQGVINSILVSLGMEPQLFLNSSSQALASIIFISSWKGVGYWALFILAGLQEIPHSLYEAASIDGANRWQQFRAVTLPMLKRTLTFVTVSVTIANMMLFAPMYILTNGGPAGSTNVLLLESYNSAFVYSDMGRSSAIVVIMVLITSIVIAFQFKFLRSDD